MGGHRLQLLVHPEHVGRVEAALVGGALYMLQEAQSRAVWATVNRANAAGLDVLRSYGFEEKRTLLTMSKDLR
jgi:hypothetical protein